MATERRGVIRYDRLGNRRYYLGDKEVSKVAFDATFPAKPCGVPMTPSGAIWPMTSEALACHPAQVDAMNAMAKKNGIAASYEPGTGLVTIADRAARKRLLKVEGKHDRSGGYGD